MTGAFNDSNNKSYLGSVRSKSSLTTGSLLLRYRVLTVVTRFPETEDNHAIQKSYKDLRSQKAA